MPKTATFFECSYISVDASSRTLKFAYTIGFPDEETKVFTETVVLPQDLPLKRSLEDSLVQNILQNIHLVLGMSYWKLYCPKEIRVPLLQLTKEQADFWNTTYTKGLGEFFYKNTIDFRGLVQFPYQEFTPSLPQKIELTNRSILPVGGGKDSLVSAQVLLEKHAYFDLFAVNPHPLQHNISEIMQKKLFATQRIIDPQVFELVASKGVYDGHVPISAFHMFMYLLSAVLFDYRFVIFSNEKSASYGNIEYLGEEINHQWSKSEEFEHMFQNYIERYLVKGVVTFSLLRPYYEIEITRRFAKTCQLFFHTFSSCNRNFALQGSKNNQGKLWCGKCEKCAFVFALLAAFLPKQELVGIFGKNLYEDDTLIPTYEALLGLREFKPFECVGTPEEMKMAMRRALNREDYKDDPILKRFAQNVSNTSAQKTTTQDVFATYDTSMIPQEFL